ncbi:MAG TPA: CDP-archaeol synthase [Methylomirabilota bacterium]|nr:CDP-archaeol synthase [Methylomirabilota bacterium]
MGAVPGVVRASAWSLAVTSPVRGATVPAARLSIRSLSHLPQQDRDRFAAGQVGALVTTLVQHGFFKRRLGIAPGRPWLPFDQFDFVLGALSLVAPRQTLTARDLAVLLVLTFAGHIAISRMASWLGLRDVKW